MSLDWLPKCDSKKNLTVNQTSTKVYGLALILAGKFSSSTKQALNVFMNHNWKRYFFLLQGTRTKIYTPIRWHWVLRYRQLPMTSHQFQLYLWHAGYLQTIRGKTGAPVSGILSSHRWRARSSSAGRCPSATCSAPRPRTGSRRSPPTARSRAPPAWCSPRCPPSSPGSLSSGPWRRTRACCSYRCAGSHGMGATFYDFSCRAEQLSHNMDWECAINYRTKDYCNCLWSLQLNGLILDGLKNGSDISYQ